MATEQQHTNGALSDEEWEVISDAVETLEIWSKQVFLDDKGCRPMWNPTLRRLRNLLATRTNRPVSFTLEQLSAYLDANTINYLRNRLITLASKTLKSQVTVNIFTDETRNFELRNNGEFVRYISIGEVRSIIADELQKEVRHG